MKLFYYIPGEKRNNGPRNFFRLLKKYLIQNGHQLIEFSNKAKEKEILFSNFCLLDVETARIAQNLGMKLIVRADGLHPVLYEYLKELERYVDLFIFQSEYSRRAFLSRNPNIKNCVIYNGTKIVAKIEKVGVRSLFFYSKYYEIREPHKYHNVLKPLVQDWCNKNYIEFVEHFKGRNVLIGEDAFLKILEKTDCLVHTVNEDPCPNTVIEAMARSNPVIGLNNGGVPELTLNELLIDAENPKTVLVILDNVRDNYVKYRDLSYDRCVRNFNIEDICKKYEEMFWR